MNAKELATFLVDELQDKLTLHLKPNAKNDYAVLDVEDEYGNTFAWKLIQMNAVSEDEDEDNMSDCISSDEEDASL